MYKWYNRFPNDNFLGLLSESEKLLLIQLYTVGGGIPTKQH